jgi:Ca-activated chloride channel homolog
MDTRIDPVRKSRSEEQTSSGQAVSANPPRKGGSGHHPGILIIAASCIAVAGIIVGAFFFPPGNPVKTTASTGSEPLMPIVVDNGPGPATGAEIPAPIPTDCFIELPNDSIVRQGEVLVMKDGKKLSLPLIHTSVTGTIDGFLARVTLTQKFVNPGNSTIEALYTFPLPENAAVDSMLMTIGGRKIVGIIKERGEARAIYEEARREGKTASLLEQERPNIFTQSIANILKKDTIRITISYVQVLKYINGSYQFVFPMVVGPRYIPGQITRLSSHGREQPTNEVSDADRITPPLVCPEFRSGHEIDLSLAINAGTPVAEVRSPSHKTDIRMDTGNTLAVSIAANDRLPNKDFILEYTVAQKEITPVFLSHRSADTGFFQLILVPEIHTLEKEIFPRELVFVVDNSGSMGGFPIEKCKELISLCINRMRPDDVFRLITFSGSTAVLSENPLAASSDNKKKALDFVNGMNGGGGTEMMGAIDEIFASPAVPGRKRLVFFLTDGFVGNDQAIITSISRRLGSTRVFSMGIGSSPNRYLIEGMAYAGRGSASFIRQDGDADRAMNDFYRLIDAPVLTDISLHFDGLDCFDILPQNIPDLFASQPLCITGKYRQPAKGSVQITGSLARGKTWSEKIPVSLAGREPAGAALPTLWARQKIAEYELFGSGIVGKQSYTPDDIKEKITVLGLRYRIMTEFTSFVAVDKEIRNRSGKWVSVEQAVDLPEGVSPQSQPGYRYLGTGGFSSGIDAVLGGMGGLKRGGTGGMGAGRITSKALFLHKAGGTCGGGGDPRARITKSGVLGVISGKASGRESSADRLTNSLTPGSLSAKPVNVNTAAANVSLLTVTGGRNKAGVQRILSQNFSAIRYAYNKRLRVCPGLKGRITMKFAIDEFGKVIFCQMVQSTLNDPAFEAMVTEKIKRYAFDKIDKPGDVTEGVYTLEFAPMATSRMGGGNVQR